MDLGPRNGRDTLGGECWNNFLKDFIAHCRNNIEEPLHRRYILAALLDLFRCQHPSLFDHDPRNRSLAGCLQKDVLSAPVYTTDTKLQDLLGFYASPILPRSTETGADAARPRGLCLAEIRMFATLLAGNA